METRHFSVLALYLCSSLSLSSQTGHPSLLTQVALSSSPVCPEAHWSQQKSQRKGDKQFSAQAPGNTVLSLTPYSSPRSRNHWLGRQGNASGVMLVGHSFNYLNIPLGLRS